ncbi:MAG: FAD binding domain-containing protein, partial [Pseudomonadota bacterium]
MVEPIRFSLNGNPVEAACRADVTVLEYLRLHAGLTGTKEGCAEGDCSACSVLFAATPTVDGTESQLKPVNSCILLMGQVDGGALVTVEGLAASAQGGHPVQQAMAKNGSSQCGFCTPGIVTALAGLLENNASPSEAEIHDALAGNLCRCTGYRPIVEAAFAAALENKPALPATVSKPSVSAGQDESRFLRPSSLDELQRMRRDDPEAVLLAGGTDLSLDVAHARSRWPLAILTNGVADLRAISETDSAITFGAAVTWDEMLPSLSAHWPSFATLVRRFGSAQIRAVGTLGGNLGTASPIGDGAPSLISLGAQITLAGSEGQRSLPLEDFFLDYRKTALSKDEIIAGITVPKLRADQQFRVYKVSKRYDQDISTVCGAFCVAVENDRITEARIAYGGMAAVPIRVGAAEAALLNQPLCEPSMEAA